MPCHNHSCSHYRRESGKNPCKGLRRHKLEHNITGSNCQTPEDETQTQVANIDFHERPRDSSLVLISIGLVPVSGLILISIGLVPV
ncbi:predicted protein [Methanosarcina acetivorans C2A]|uniref:Uncharacterized protein n=1 Tax=Methanosarcina acetivorans (strain ATCC 35395 / DSM 2834 / JCM 12185 / C2A) TaxID=188937 RepID=Q8TP70_METAC|nr:predicted protein [Methanosarcina acetivorans C2A]